MNPEPNFPAQESALDRPPESGGVASLFGNKKSGGSLNESKNIADIFGPLTGETQTLLGIPVRNFTLADQALLSRADSRFIVARDGDMDVLIEACLFLYLMQSRFTVREAAKESSLPRLELEDRAIEFAACLGKKGLMEMVTPIKDFVSDTKSTQVEVIEEKGASSGAPKND